MDKLCKICGKPLKEHSLDTIKHVEEAKKEFEKERKEDIKLFNEAFETWVKTHPKWSEGVRERASKILTGILTRQFENKIRKQERQKILQKIEEKIKNIQNDSVFVEGDLKIVFNAQEGILQQLKSELK